jgi:hypothetical protein
MARRRIGSTGTARTADRAGLRPLEIEDVVIRQSGCVALGDGHDLDDFVGQRAAPGASGPTI